MRYNIGDRVRVNRNKLHKWYKTKDCIGTIIYVYKDIYDPPHYLVRYDIPFVSSTQGGTAYNGLYESDELELVELVIEQYEDWED